MVREMPILTWSAPRAGEAAIASARQSKGAATTDDLRNRIGLVMFARFPILRSNARWCTNFLVTFAERFVMLFREFAAGSGAPTMNSPSQKTIQGIYGHRARIGYTCPPLSAEIFPYEFYKLVPDGVTLVITTLTVIES